MMIALGFNAAVSVRVSNELGAGKPKAAKYSIVVTVSTSVLFGLIFTSAILGGKRVAVGAGWQFQVACMNVGCYYVFGLPIGALLGYKFDFGVQGIWSGMLAGSLLQTVLQSIYIYRTNWEIEVLQVEDRIRTWGEPSEFQDTDDSQQPSI
ncbi:Detoxification-like protein [Thalictrum thalictroides]|uniref:Detoxification-like protein n=1 Tax=Thalictrum thalictroides TaxID=46969 RepID=A0A7J6VSA2_THATH|nr:Detoxification-like protein [Thalictrum thalictroides]